MTNKVETIEQLEALYSGGLAEATLRKETPCINAEYRQLIEAAPFFAIASIGPEGMDCSPRGDGPGFVKILDECTVAFPDRRGNNRLDTLRNIVVDPRVALLFLIPGWNETLRINGTAHLTTDGDLLERFEVKGRRPVTAVIVKIDTMYFQCARALKRAALWDVSAQVDPKNLPSAGRLVQSVMQEFDAEDYDAKLHERQARTLY
ncbi:MAG: pyridoxamine 5'-phosphate oxidase family protein [Rhizobiaceae bacterium]